MRVVLRIKESEGQWVPWFYCTEVEDVVELSGVKDIPEVAMSRDGDHCYTEVTQLQDHNGHAPAFKGTLLCRMYVARVQKDVESTINAYASSSNLTTEVKCDNIIEVV